MLHKDLLSLENLSRNEIEGLLRLALDLKLRLTVGEKLSHLTGQRLVLLFYEPSTRTRVSFAQAAYLGGAEVISVTTNTSSVTKGESLVDTARTLEATGASALVLRHQAAGAATLVASRESIPVINA